MVDWLTLISLKGERQDQHIAVDYNHACPRRLARNSSNEPSSSHPVSSVRMVAASTCPRMTASGLSSGASSQTVGFVFLFPFHTSGDPPRRTVCATIATPWQPNHANDSISLPTPQRLLVHTQPLGCTFKGQSSTLLCIMHLPMNYQHFIIFISIYKLTRLLHLYRMQPRKAQPVLLPAVHDVHRLHRARWAAFSSGCRSWRSPRRWPVAVKLEPNVGVIAAGQNLRFRGSDRGPCAPLTMRTAGPCREYGRYALKIFFSAVPGLTKTCAVASTPRTLSMAVALRCTAGLRGPRRPSACKISAV